ncbi:MAG TPA: HD domain-containing protein [Planctomycetota bacterium]|nr:HD domain-containing protein [Planctomycetota bacterium]
MVKATTSDATEAPYTAVPIVGLVAADAVPFPLYLRTARDVWVLYRPTHFALDESHVGRLQAEGVTQLFIRDADRDSYFAHVESTLPQILLERGMPLERRADVLYGVAKKVALDLLTAPPDRDAVQRASRVMMATSGLLLRETQGFAAIRKVMTGSRGLAAHSLTVGFMAMGLARNVLAGDAGTLLWAGLAGLLHDVGKVGHDGIGHDPEHPARGAEYLARLGLPAPVVDAAMSHHERQDGSGYPTGLRGPMISELASVVGLADTFDKIYSAEQPRVGVFDALRILAQAYRGCFEERFTRGLVKLFR